MVQIRPGSQSATGSQSEVWGSPDMATALLLWCMWPPVLMSWPSGASTPKAVTNRSSLSVLGEHLHAGDHLLKPCSEYLKHDRDCGSLCGCDQVYGHSWKTDKSQPSLSERQEEA